MEIKVKIGGGKYKARFMEQHEVINERSVYAFDYYTSAEYIRENIQNYKLYPTRCVGELVSEHNPKHRVYLEITSPHYKTFEGYWER